VFFIQKIILLHDSFISDFFLKTIKRNNFSVFAEENLRKELLNKKINVLSLIEAKEKLSGDCLVYFNAEDCISLIEENSSNIKLKKNIAFFKNKFVFKNSIKENYPDCFVAELKKEDFDSFIVPEGKDLIIKPVIGFHSVGIKRFSGQKEWIKIKDEILAECKKYAGVFDVNVLNDKKFLVEEFIEGKEFACDFYFNSKGKPVILNISKHVFADENDVRDLVYYTSAGLIKEHFEKMKDFLDLIASKKKIRNFPVHLEVRIKNNKIYPIEANPLRFGGFGLAELSFYAFGFNSFEYFFNQKEPDWNKLCSSGDKNFYAFVVGQRPSNFNSEKESIDVEEYKKTFNEILDYVPVNPVKYKFFSTTFARSEKLEDLTKYLFLDFDKFRVLES